MLLQLTAINSLKLVCAGRLSPALIPLVLFCCVFAPGINAATITTDLEVHLLRNVSTSWQTVPLSNNYTNAIPICTYNLASFADTKPNYSFPPAVVRIRNITSSAFDVRIQGWEDTAAIPGDVHCLVTDTGAHTLPDGRKYEAYTVESDKTGGRYATDGAWSQALLENVSGSISNTYSKHVVLGQVISFRDNRASVFNTSDCESRTAEPYNAGHADGICVGKHIGQIAGNRKTETVGYLVAEAGSGTVNGISYELKRGADSIAGNNGGNTGYKYSVTGNYTVGVLSQVGEDGGDGSWAVLYGSDPLPANQIALAVDEEIFAGDTSRNHTTEIVDYWIFGTAELTLQKKVVNDDGRTASIADFKLSASGPNQIEGYSGDAITTDASIASGTYTLAETGPDGYTGTWSCTGTTLTGDTITLQIGTDAVCTLLNNDNPLEAYLTLEKKVVNDNGGTAAVTDFTLTYGNGAGISGSGIQGEAPVTNVKVPPGSYKLTENTIQGYSLTKIVCNGLDANGLDGLTITNGEDVICTYVNDDKGIDLVVLKTVSDTSPNIGEVVTFTIKVTNNGPDNATEVHVTDVVKPGFDYVAASMTGGTTMTESSPTGSGLDWGIQNLASNASVILTFQAIVASP